MSIELQVTKPTESTPLVPQQPKPSCCSLKVKLVAGVLLIGTLVTTALLLVGKSPCGPGEKQVAYPDKLNECLCALLNSTLPDCVPDPSGLRP